MAASYSVNTIAELLGITARRVQQLALRGINPKPARGKYELVPSIQGYCKHLREQLAGQGEATLTSKRIEQLEENIAKSRKINLIFDRELAHIVTVEKILTQLISEWNQKLGSLPSNCQDRLELCSTAAERKEVMEAEVEALKSELRDVDIARILAEACDAGLEVATKIKAKPVGGKVRAPKRGKQRRNG